MSYTFDLATPAPPDVVWAALTTPERTAGYLAGLTACSTWEPGTAVTFTAAGGAVPPLAGEVLAAAEPVRLSYTVGAGPGQPVTYVTWEVTAAGQGSTVRLSVDDPDLLAAGARESDAESVWAGVIEGLGAVLTTMPGRWASSGPESSRSTPPAR